MSWPRGRPQSQKLFQPYLRKFFKLEEKQIKEKESPPEHGEDIGHAAHPFEQAVQLVGLLLQEPHSFHLNPQDGSHFVLQCWELSCKENNCEAEEEIMKALGSKR